MNLTRYTLWGIMNHSSLKYKNCEYCKNKKECRYKNCGKECQGILSVSYYDSLPYKPVDEKDWTLEGVIVAYADEIAQRHHDIEDGVFAGIIDIGNLCDFLKSFFDFHTGFSDLQAIKDSLKKNNSKSEAIQKLSRIIINAYVTEYCDNLAKVVNDNANKLSLNTADNSWRATLCRYIKQQSISIIDYFSFSKEFKIADKKLEKYLSHHILDSYIAQCMDGKASFIIKQLVKAYLTNPQQLPDNTIIAIINDWNNSHSVKPNGTLDYKTEASKSRERLKDLINDDDPIISSIFMRRICDHIAGMTDQYAMSSFEKLYGSKGYL